MARHAEMNNWFKFCKEKVDKIEKVWNKKLEDDSVDTNDEDPTPDGDENKQNDEKEDYEKALQEMFENFGKRGKSF